ncbi:hypothetical protein KGV52_00230 [Candidatus Gracilibacteria bacterium]|nr:hypothetical protein [Candidatus Gracilibacteria bacterium]
MKKIFFLFLVLLFSIPMQVHADFQKVEGTKQFKKIGGGQKTLKVYENTLINPFKDVQIVKLTTNCTGNACGSSQSTNYYTLPKNITVPTNQNEKVNLLNEKGKLYNEYHSLYLKKGELLSTGETIINKRKAKVTTTLLENTYDKEGVPRQKVKVRKDYIIQYDYDTTPPTCGDLRFYTDNSLSKKLDIQAEQWLNKEYVYTITCNDPETGCKNTCTSEDDTCKSGKRIVEGNPIDYQISKPEGIYHLMQPKATFSNNVELTTICSPKDGNFKILYDKEKPRLKANLNNTDLRINFPGNSYINNKKDDGSHTEIIRDTISKKAGKEPTILDIELKDLYTPNSKSGVSGIKKYTIDLFRITETNFDLRDVYKGKEPTEVIYAKGDTAIKTESKTFEKYNADGTVKKSDIKTNIRFDASEELRKSGSYMYHIEVEDFAGNKIDAFIPLNIFPGEVDKKNSSIGLNPTGKNKNDAFANVQDTYEYFVRLKDAFQNPIGTFDTILSYNHKIKEGKIVKQKGQPKYLHKVAQNGENIIFLDNVKKRGEQAFKTFGKEKINKNGEVVFPVASYTPGVFDENFALTLPVWNAKYKVISTKKYPLSTGQKNSFKNILTAYLDGVSSINRSGIFDKNKPERVEIGKAKYYGIGLNRVDSGDNKIKNGGLIGAYVNPALSYYDKDRKGHLWEQSVRNNYITRKGDSGFSETDKQVSVYARLNADTNVAKSALTVPRIGLEKMDVSYILKNKRTRYIFSANGTLDGIVGNIKIPKTRNPKKGNPQIGNPKKGEPEIGNPIIEGPNIFPPTTIINPKKIYCEGGICIEETKKCDPKTEDCLCEKISNCITQLPDAVHTDAPCKLETLGIKVTGTIQGGGNMNATTSEGKNYTDLSLSTFRAQIRKNAYILKRGLQSGNKVGKILYYTGDKKYSDIKSKLTTGDTLILENGNFIIDNNIDKKIGVIILAENYNTEKNPGTTKGNIFVRNTVKNINAALYADGAFISAKENGGKYSNEELAKERLILQGVLFSRNTIGGSLENTQDGTFLLPGNKKTKDYELSYRYDLNYIRTVQSDCKTPQDKKYSFWLQYDSSFKTNPPKGFAN